MKLIQPAFSAERWGDVMKTNQLSTCFCTSEVNACKKFYIRHFAATPTFDCGWYVTLRIDQGGPEINFIEPQEGMSVFDGTGITLNFNVDDVDAEHARLVSEGLLAVMPLEDHPWGDRGFSVVDPIGNSVYVYSDREPSAEFKQYYAD